MAILIKLKANIKRTMYLSFIRCKLLKKNDYSGRGGGRRGNAFSPPDVVDSFRQWYFPREKIYSRVSVITCDGRDVFIDHKVPADGIIGPVRVKKVIWRRKFVDLETDELQVRNSTFTTVIHAHVHTYMYTWRPMHTHTHTHLESRK